MNQSLIRYRGRLAVAAGLGLSRWPRSWPAATAVGRTAAGADRADPR